MLQFNFINNVQGCKFSDFSQFTILVLFQTFSLNLTCIPGSGMNLVDMLLSVTVQFLSPFRKYIPQGIMKHVNQGYKHRN